MSRPSLYANALVYASSSTGIEHERREVSVGSAHAHIVNLDAEQLRSWCVGSSASCRHDRIACRTRRVLACATLRRSQQIGVFSADIAVASLERRMLIKLRGNRDAA